MFSTDIKRSSIDHSVNFIMTHESITLEARYVRRTDDTVIVYLSSAGGCNLTCRFCHLTQTRQVLDNPIVFNNYLIQAEKVIGYAKTLSDWYLVKYIHFNFMARGDALTNPVVTNNWVSLRGSLEKIVDDSGILCKFKISTIFPENLILPNQENNTTSLFKCGDLTDDCKNVEIYYSLYSLNFKFRRKWLPKAKNPDVVGIYLSHIPISNFRIHHALISGENDSEKDAEDIVKWLDKYDLRCPFNLVSYNPFDSSSSESSPEVISRYIEILQSSDRIISVQRIERIGLDVHASCGMFDLV